MKRVIMLIRTGVGFLTKNESLAYRDFCDIENAGDDEPIACGAPLAGPAIPIPGINRDGHMLSIIETTWTPREITLRLSEADDYLPTIAIDITDQLENDTISINAQMADSPVGAMFVEVFGLEPQGEYDKEEEEEKQKAEAQKIKNKLKKARKDRTEGDDEDCDCPACQLRQTLSDKFGESGAIEIGGIEELKDLLDKLVDAKGIREEREGMKSEMSSGAKKKPVYKKKSCNLNMDQLLDLIKEKGGVDKLEDSQIARLHELSKQL